VRIDTSSKRMIFAVTISDKRVLKTMNRLIHPSAWKGNSRNFALPEFYEVRLTAYCGTTATASISTKKSGCARPETNAIVMAGGLGVWGQAF
jgi:hypothetical protein